MVANSDEEVGKTAIDYFSWSHINMGLVSFMLLSLINIIPSMVTSTLVYLIPYWSMILLVIVVMLIWELFENFVLYKWGAKFENRQDTLLNATWDVIFGIIGGFYMWVIKGILVNLIGLYMVPVYFIICLISFIVCLAAFLIGRAISK